MDVLWLVVLGLVAGAAGATLGVGGGLIIVPALVVLFSLDQHVAQGTSLAVILPTAIIGTVGHARRGRVIWNMAIPIATGALLGALIGSRLALALSGDTLRILFAVLLTILAVRMFVRSFRPPTEQPSNRRIDGLTD